MGSVPFRVTKRHHIMAKLPTTEVVVIVVSSLDIFLLGPPRAVDKLFARKCTKFSETKANAINTSLSSMT